MASTHRATVIASFAAVLALASCGDSGQTAASTSTNSSSATTSAAARSCIVRLHGKGGAGAATVDIDGVTEVAPNGNAEGWGGQQWIYFPPDSAVAARQIVAESIETADCTDVVIDGFSNGAAFAAKLYCGGETFGGTVRGVVIDDPVPDASADDCEPGEGVDAVLYWTGALAADSAAGTDCAVKDWTCEGGSTIGIDRFASNLGLAIMASPNSEHAWYRDAPQIRDWLAP